MTPRGPYSKGIAKRAEILDAALTTIAEHGYSGATVKELAEAVGLSQNGLLHYFGSKDALFAAIVKHRDERDSSVYDGIPPGEDFGASVGDFIHHNAQVPGLVQLYARLSNEATEPEHTAHEFFRDRCSVIRERSATLFQELIDAGKIRADLDPDALAVILTALNDGLQTQWMYDPDLEMPHYVQVFLDLLRS